jgi:hypothetical protein
VMAAVSNPVDVRRMSNPTSESMVRRKPTLTSPTIGKPPITMPFVQREMIRQEADTSEKANQAIQQYIQRTEQETSLPLKKAAPVEQIQRETGNVKSKSAMWEKKTGSKPRQTKPNAPPADLDQLARDIYPLIMRMMVIERERTRGR